MNVSLSSVNQVTIILLVSILIVQGLDMMFAIGLNHPLFHLFWLIVACYVGVIIGIKVVG